MIRRLLAIAAALALAACGEAARDWPAPSPALWEVVGEHGEHAWLFGTIHALPDGAEWRTPVLERALTESDLLMVEIGNLGDADEATRAFDAYAITSALPPLSARVPEADRPALAALMERAGRDDADFWNVETWAAALMLADEVRDAEAGNGVDRALMGGGKPVLGMETFTDQFARFDRLDERQQAILLADLAREAARDGSEARVEAWLTGDLAALEREMAQSFLADPALRRSLLDERNAIFAAQVAERMERGRTPLVAIGAAHMAGDGGLPALLAARGYTVRRLQ